MEVAIAGLVGLLVGLIVGAVITFIAVRYSEQKQREERDQLIENLRSDFKELSQQALNASNKQLLSETQERLAYQTERHTDQLETKKQLIDQQLGRMSTELTEVRTLIQQFEQAREHKLGQLGNELQNLLQTSNELQRALASTGTRGQWGERIADDILRLAGFVEGINYDRQHQQSGGRPDFTFSLPNGHILNMDVKFPLDNYLKYARADNDSDREKYKRTFLKDIKGHVQTLAKRGYNATDQNTIDTVLMFIPNEQVYRFIHESDDSIIDTALEQNIVMCSPLTLYVVLAVIRQAIENFRLEQSSRQILTALNTFRAEWQKYVGKMEELGKALDKASQVYEELSTKRRRELDTAFRDVHDLLDISHSLDGN